MKRKVSLITISDNANFGSMLQCYALYYALKNLGCDAEIVDYIRERRTYKRAFQRMFLSGSPANFLLGFVRIPNQFLNDRIYHGFLRRNAVLTAKQYYSPEELKQDPPVADIYMTGSDQVWNTLYNESVDDSFFLGFVSEGKVKVAYSASFGRTELPEEEMNRMKGYLSQYKAISVREKSAVDILSKMGISNVEHTLDPTFLLTRFDWQAMMSKRIVREPYLLIFVPYAANDFTKIVDAARRVANEKGLKLVAFSWDFRNMKGVDRTIKYADPGDFLSLFHYADYVVTNSFHGTAFSINLNKQFFSFYPSRHTTRLKSILELVGLQSRIFSEDVEWSKIPEDIDYDKVNALLDAQRDKSLKYLNNCLNL